eukprot:6205047-Pleurochrysis_carterae.AAC.1
MQTGQWAREPSALSLSLSPHALSLSAPRSHLLTSARLFACRLRAPPSRATCSSSSTGSPTTTSSRHAHAPPSAE